jgi:hypothetical protein
LQSIAHLEDWNETVGTNNAGVTVSNVQSHFKGRLASLLVEFEHLRRQEALLLQKGFIHECTEILTEPSLVNAIDPHAEKQGACACFFHAVFLSTTSLLHKISTQMSQKLSNRALKATIKLQYSTHLSVGTLWPVQRLVSLDLANVPTCA